MSEPTTAGTASDVDRRRLLFWVVVVVVAGVLLIGGMTLLPFWDDVVGSGTGAYLAVLALIFGDGVFPVLPGETTLNAASVSAAEGNLQLGWVFVAGGLGAVLGDSCVYWVARSLHGPWHDKLMRTAAQPRAASFLTVFKDRAGLMIVFGRYIPGVRLVVNVTMGSVVRLPYPRFLRWSALAGFLWSGYTCVLAYAVASVLEDSPLASIIISGLITSGALVVIGATLRRGMKKDEREKAASNPTGVPG